MPLPFLAPALMAGGSALLGGLSSATAHKGKLKKLDLLTPEQKRMAQFARTQGMNQIQNPYQGFEPIAQQAQQAFYKQTVPTLAERFTSMGAGNALSSPAFVNQLGAAGQDLSSNLAAMMANYGQHQQALGQGLLGMGMRPEFENYYRPESQGFLSSLLGSASRGLGSMGGVGFEKAYTDWADKRSGNDLESILKRLGGSNTNPYGSAYNPFLTIQGR